MTPEEQTEMSAAFYANTEKERRWFIKGAEWERRVDKWHTDMPEFDGFYLCVVEHSTECGNTLRYMNVVQCMMNRWILFDKLKVTHWQPLPEPPKQKEDQP